MAMWVTGNRVGSDRTPRRFDRVFGFAAFVTMLLTIGIASPAQAATGFTSAPAPVVTGAAVVGQTLTAQAGMWSPTPDSLSYQWRRNGTAISGATAKTYRVSTADSGRGLTVAVTARKSGHTTTARGSTTWTVGTAFTTAAVPTVTGSGTVGTTLTGKVGAWAPAPERYFYQWNRSGVPVSGATAASYVLTAADLGASVTLTVVGNRSGYGTTSRTSATTPVSEGSFSSTPTPTVSGTAKTGQTLTADAGAWTPTPDTLTYQWARNGRAVTGETTRTYVVRSDDAASDITVAVTGTKAGYRSATATSAVTAIPGAQFTGAPTPTISGTVGAGAVLTAQPGTWTPAPTSFSFEWRRDGVAVGTTSTYTVRDADEGSSLTVVVSARRAGYETTSRTSAPLTVDIPDVLRYKQRAIIDANADWLMPSVRLVILEEGATVTSRSILRIGPGVTVKFDDRGMTVEGTLRAKGSTTSPAVLTSLKDDSAAGDSNGDGSASFPSSSGDWDGIDVEYGATLDIYKAQVKNGRGVSAPGTENDYDAQEWPELVQIQQSSIDGTVHAFDGPGCWWGGCGSVIVVGDTISGNLELLGGAERASGNRILGLFELAGLFDPVDRHTGNVFTGSTRVIRLCARLASDWTIPTDGTQVVLFGPGRSSCAGGLDVPAGVTLTIPAGVTVRTEPDYSSYTVYDDTPEELQTGPVDEDWSDISVEGRLMSTASADRPAVLTTASGVCDDDDDFTDRWGGVKASEESSVDLRNITLQCVLPHKQFVQSTAPVIEGSRTIGSELTVTDGDWTPTPYAFLHIWLRNGTEIPGAFRTTYTVTPEDAGTTLTVQTRAYHPGYITTTKRSAPIAIPR